MRKCSNPKSLNNIFYMLASYEDLEEDNLGEINWQGYFCGWCFVHKNQVGQTQMPCK